MQLQRLATASFAASFTALFAGTALAQYGSAPTAYNFTDIASTGTPLGLAGTEDGGASLPLGFDFTFYGAPINSIAATSNGYLTTGTNLTEWIPDCPLPNALTPNGVIAPFFDDLSLTDHGEIFYQTLGAAPNRVAIVQWEDSGAFLSSASSATFQVQLFEADSSIEYHYETLTSPTFPILGDNAFVGVESSTGDSAETIHCQAGVPVLTPGVSAYRVAPAFPYINAPAEVVTGELFNVTGVAAPGTLYVFAWSLSNGPLGPIPTLENITLNLGLNFKLAGTGLTPASGMIASDTLLAPSGFNGTPVYWQAITIGSFGPLANISVSNSDSTTLRDGAVFMGSIPGPGAADSYSMPGTAGDVVSIYHCRTDNTGGMGGTLDPYLCLVDPSGVVEDFDDDSAGDCLVTGPWGASEIVDHTLLQTGNYTVYASAHQFTPPGNEAGTYRLTILGPGAPATVLLVDDGPICPGNAFENPAAKLLHTQPARTRR
ncbi:MAG: hypothetical protein WD226_10915 [Planctomycetota bacterium]